MLLHRQLEGSAHEQRDLIGNLTTDVELRELGAEKHLASSASVDAAARTARPIFRISVWDRQAQLGRLSRQKAEDRARRAAQVQQWDTREENEVLSRSSRNSVEFLSGRRLRRGGDAVRGRRA